MDDDGFVPIPAALAGLAPDELRTAYERDPQPFGELCVACWQPVAAYYGTAMPLSAADIYLKLDGYLARWRGEGPFTHYLTTIIRKECARQLRPDPHFVAVETLADVADPAAGVEDEVIQREEAARMVAFFDLEGEAMRRLIRAQQRAADLRQRCIFWVRLLAHLPYDTLMRSYQVEQEAAQQMIDNFRKRLQRFLRACYPGLNDQAIVHRIVHGTEEEL